MQRQYLSSIISLIGLLFVPIGYWHKPFLSTAWLLCAIFAVCAIILDVIVHKDRTGAFLRAGIAFLAFGYALQSFIPYSVVYGFGLFFVMNICAAVISFKAASKASSLDGNNKSTRRYWIALFIGGLVGFLAFVFSLRLFG